MSKALTVARRIQIGKESTRGTAVAATRKIATKSATYRINPTHERFPDLMHGTLANTAQAPVNTRNATEFEIVNDLDFEQILLPLLSGLKGGVTPSTPGTGEARLWTFTPAIDADPLPTTYTIEFADRDMDASPNELGHEAPFGITTGFQITGGRDMLPQLTTTMVARKSSITASTGALSLPTLSHAGNLRWALYMDSAWANLGNTQIIGEVFGFTYTFSEFLQPDYFLDNRADLDFSSYKFNPRVVDLVIDATLGVASSDLVPTEDDLLTTKRFIRLGHTGAAFDSPDDSLSRFVRLDGAYYHEDDSMADRGTDQDGNAITRLHLKSTYDSVQAQDIEIAVQNNLTAFP